MINRTAVLLVLLVLLNVISCSMQKSTLQNLSRLVSKWNVDEMGQLNPEILHDLFLTASNGQEQVSAPADGYQPLNHDPIVSLFLHKNIDPECYSFLISKGVPVTYYHLKESLKIKNRPIFEVLLDGKNQKGNPIRTCKSSITDLVVEYVYLGSLDQVNLILESFPDLKVLPLCLSAATGNEDVDMILALLPRVPFIDGETIRFAISKCKEARLLSALVKRSINPNYFAHSGKSPIVAAISKSGDAVALFNELLEAGADLYSTPETLFIYEETLFQPDLRQRVHLLMSLLESKVGRKGKNEVMSAVEDLNHGFKLYKLITNLDEESALLEFPAEIRLYILHLMLHDALRVILKECP